MYVVFCVIEHITSHECVKEGQEVRNADGISRFVAEVGGPMVKGFCCSWPLHRISLQQCFVWSLCMYLVASVSVHVKCLKHVKEGM